jgi:hypothetical protein
VAWQLRDGRHFCDRHDHDFPRGEVCQLCVDDPGPAPGDGEQDDEDRELIIREREYRSMEKFLHRRARELIEDGTERDVHAAAKLLAEGTKLARIALEIHNQLLDLKLERKLIKHDRELAGLESSH